MSRAAAVRKFFARVNERYAKKSRSTRRSSRPRLFEPLERREVLAAFISEVHPAGSGNGTYAADWFEVTNTGNSDLDISGWRMDDSSNALATSVALRGLMTIPPGKSAVFFEGNAAGSTDATIIASFSTTWFGVSTLPTGFLIGAYGGSGVGLSTSGDAVNLFNSSGTLITGVSFGAAAAPSRTFDNTAGQLAVSTLSTAGINSAFVSSNGAETGSPGKTITTVDLSTYVRVGRFDLPEPTRTTPPAGSLLAQEVSAVTYNWDTDTLFVVGDGGTSIVQVTKTGQLIDSMTLAAGGSPQGTEFYDPEGLTYVGGGQFVMVEERDRRANLFAYEANTTLDRADAQTVQLGTFIGNIGIEGISYDPQTSGFIAVKETQPQGIFQTGIDFAAGTATNGSPATENSIDLFDPALANLLDLAEIFALSNLPSLSGQADYSHLLVLSQEEGKIVNIDRSGNISSALTIVSDAGNPLSVSAQQHEGLTMDRNGFLYVVSENGGGDFDHPQLWVYAPSSVPNQAPTAVVLSNQVSSIVENTSTAVAIKVAEVSITDDGLGTNSLSLSGADSSFFEITGGGLFLKAGTILDFETKTSYSVAVNVDDATVGGAPDATATFNLEVTDVVNETPPQAALIISEVAPWSSGNSPVGADWFEVTNTTGSSVDIAGWRMDDNSNSFASAVALSGITTIAAGESVIFIETANLAAAQAAFLSAWFGASPPANLQIGSYSGGGVGLSTGGDAVSLYNGSGALQANVSFGASPAGPVFASFNNAAGLNNAAISQLSVVGVNGAFVAASDANEIGSPGTVGELFISEVAPWSSGNSPVGADWFEVTNTTAHAVDITGWKMDDSSGSFVAAVALSGITSIEPGESVIFVETADLAATSAAFRSTWFGANPPAGLQIGSYTGGGVGLSTGGDEVNLYNSSGVVQARVVFGPSPTGPFPSFDNAAGLNNTVISQLSAAGVNGAFAAVNNSNEIGSPGVINNVPPVAGNDDVTTAEDTAVTFNVLTNDTDADGDSLTITSFTGPGTGTLVSNGNGSFTYTPAPNFNGDDLFTYIVSDGRGGVSTSASVAITVTAVNEPPLANQQSISTSEGSSVAGTLTGEDGDPEVTQSLTYAIARGPAHGSVTLDSSTGAFTYRPSAGYSGPDSFTFTVQDDAAAGLPAGLVSTAVTVAINVTPVEPGTVPGAEVKNGVLKIVGTSNADIVGVTRLFNLFVVAANFLPSGVRLFPGGAIQSIDVRLGQGNDALIVAGDVGVPAILDGGSGNDVIYGGGGASVILGGAGDDRLIGGRGRNVIIGGAGRDTLIGGNATDLLIAGTTAYDSNDVALQAILKEWTSTRSYSARVANLRDGLGPVLAASGTKLKKGVTVFDDADVDDLHGGADSDWFFYDLTRDRALDKKSSETAN